MTSSNLPGPKTVTLSLTVGKGYAPFALSANERLIDHEEWAWRFIRANPKYRFSYTEIHKWQRGNPSSRVGAADFPDVHPCRLVHHGETYCRKIYGLSTWLDPETEILPKLTDGESWFSPLKNVVARPESIAGLENNTGLFGYRNWVERQDQKFDVSSTRSAGVWFVIDCSVPIDAQLSSVRFLCEQYALQLRAAGFTAGRFNLVEKPKVARIDSREPYYAHDFQLAAGGSDQLEDDDEAWRLLRIDVLGNTIKQIKGGRSLLIKVHSKLMHDGLIRPTNVRLWRSLTGSSGRGIGNPTDGDRLKCYLILAECQLAGLTSAAEIIDFLADKGAGSEVNSNISDDWNLWMERGARIKRFEQYMKETQDYLNQGYKWLIHSQNPPKAPKEDAIDRTKIG